MSIRNLIFLLILTTGCDETKSKRAGGYNIDTSKGNGKPTTNSNSNGNGQGQTVPTKEPEGPRFWTAPQNAATTKIISKDVLSVQKVGNILYAWTGQGVSISYNEGATWVSNPEPTGIEEALAFSTKEGPILALTKTNILIYDAIEAKWKLKHTFPELKLTEGAQIHIDGSKIYIANGTEVKIFSEEINEWVNKTTTDGLLGEQFDLVYADREKIYVQAPGAISFSNDSGKTWTEWQRSVPLNIEFDGFVLGQAIIKATLKGVQIRGTSTVYKTTLDGLPSDLVNAVYQNEGKIFAATALGLSVSKDGGSSWNTILPNVEVRTVRTSDGKIYAATSDGLAISADSGITWTVSTNSNEFEGVEINCVDAEGQRIIASGNVIIKGVLDKKEHAYFISEDAGLSWSQKRKLFEGTPGPRTSKICISGSGQQLFSPLFDKVYFSKDGGATFGSKVIGAKISPLDNLDVFRVANDGKNAYAVSNRSLYSTKDGGDTWEKISKETTGNIIATVTRADGSNIYGYNSSDVFISTDGGVTWTTKNEKDGLQSSFPTSASELSGIADVNISGSSIYVLAGTFVNISDDTGLTWRGIELLKNQGDTKHLLNRIKIFGTTIYVTSSAGLFLSTDNGKSWSERTTLNGLVSNDVRDVDVENETVYVATNKGLSVLNPLFPVQMSP